MISLEPTRLGMAIVGEKPRFAVVPYERWDDIPRGDVWLPTHANDVRVVSRFTYSVKGNPFQDQAVQIDRRGGQPHRQFGSPSADLRWGMITDPDVGEVLIIPSTSLQRIKSEPRTNPIGSPPNLEEWNKLRAAVACMRSAARLVPGDPIAGMSAFNNALAIVPRGFEGITDDLLLIVGNSTAYDSFRQGRA